MARRREVEIFGLSMLDTVTCGLGGGIVLMLFLASQIPPEAEVVFENARNGPETSEGADGLGEVTINTGILTVFFQYDSPRSPNDLAPKPCGSTVPQEDEARRLRLVALGPPEPDLLFQSGELERFGFSLWWRGPQADIPAVFNCFEIEVDRPCRFRYVAGAHYTTWLDCGSDKLRFERLRGTSAFFELVP